MTNVTTSDEPLILKQARIFIAARLLGLSSLCIWLGSLTRGLSGLCIKAAKALLARD
jgi:hypothetical protein